MQSLKNYKNEEIGNSHLLGVIWNSLNLTWIKYFINFYHFENSTNYLPNNIIHLKIFEFPRNITLPQKNSLIQTHSSEFDKHNVRHFSTCLTCSVINHRNSHSCICSKYLRVETHLTINLRAKIIRNQKLQIVL